MSWNLGTIYNFDGSLNIAGPSYEDLYIEGPTGNWVRKSDLQKDVKGTYNSQGAKTIQSYLQAGFDIQFQSNGTYNYALAIYGGKTLGSAAGVIWNSSFSHFGMHNGFNKGVNSFSVGTSNEGSDLSTINRIANWVGIGGVGLSASNSTFRLTNGTYNGSKFSPKLYSGWKGGSTARITTYGVSKLAGRLSTGASVVTTGFGYRSIINGTAQPITYLDTSVGTTGLVASGVKYFTGYVNPYVGLGVTTYGIWRFSYDLGASYGPRTWYGKNDYSYFE